MKPKKPLTVEALAALWVKAKAAEKEANEMRVALELEIASHLPARAEGTVSQEHGAFRVTCEYKLTRKVDSDKLSDVWAKLDPRAQAAFSWKADVKIGELRKVQEFLPDAYAALAPMLETKPAKTAVRIELLEPAVA
jgi:hypothetical protein